MMLSPEAELGRHLFARHGCNSCHAVDGHGPRVGPDLAAPQVMRSQHDLREYVLHPPPGVAMPAYANRLTDEELDQVVAFVLQVQIARR